MPVAQRTAFIVTQFIAGSERTRQITVVEQPAGESGHERARDPGIGTVAESHPEAGSLPLHATVEDSVRTTDDAVGLEEEPWADRIGKSGNERRATLEAGQGVLFDCEGMEPRTDPMRLCCPFGNVGEFFSEMRLPEGDVTNPPDSEDHDQLGPLRLQLADPLGEMGELIGRGEPPIRLGNGKRPERSVERGLHGILECAGVLRRQGHARAIAPLVHVEAVNVIAGDVPLLEEIDGPAVHSHRADGQDQRGRSILVARQFDRPGDLVPQHDVEVGDRVTGDRLKARMPPRLAFADRLRRLRAAKVDLGEVPAAGQKPLHHRAGKRC